MKHAIPSLAVAAILSYALYHALLQKEERRRTDGRHSTHPSSKETAEHTALPVPSPARLEAELHTLHTDAYREQYIRHVIDHGSQQLHFKADEVMEAGFVSPGDAPKIACYVMKLSGKRCQTEYESDAAMFYTSVCGGCHGNDGKGLNGAYPNLTRSPLLGIERREAFLKRSIAKEVLGI